MAKSRRYKNFVYPENCRPVDIYVCSRDCPSCCDEGKTCKLLHSIAPCYPEKCKGVCPIWAEAIAAYTGLDQKEG